MTLHRNRSANLLAGGASRREFLKTGAKSLGSLALPAMLPWAGLTTAGGVFASSNCKAAEGVKSVVFVYLAGGPSQLEMYDMKPNAPVEIRGEFRPINTNIPGVRVCEHLPLHAKIADKFAIVNGVETIDSHNPALIAAGDLVENERSELLRHEAAIEYQRPELPHGNWDTHGRVLGRTLSIFEELRDKLPAYDRFLHDLITDMHDRGLDKNMLIVACGEFGRTPWINEYGGRNHWATCGSVLFAGGGLKMGQTIGNTGPIGEREQNRSQAYTTKNLWAMIYRHLNIKPASGHDAQPIAELV